MLPHGRLGAYEVSTRTEHEGYGSMAVDFALGQALARFGEGLVSLRVSRELDAFVAVAREAGEGVLQGLGVHPVVGGEMHYYW